MSFKRVKAAIDAITAGKMVILTDDEDRENEGDLCFAAQFTDPEKINFMAKYGRGLICLCLSEERVEKLKLPMMVSDNNSPYGTAFTVSIEAAKGVSTGISAADRATTIQAAIHENYQQGDIVCPGHVFPLKSRDGGVLVRSGQTEGSVDLSRLANCRPSAVICEIMNEDGTMARKDDLHKFSETHGIPRVSIAELIEYRLASENLVSLDYEEQVQLGTHGEFTLKQFSNQANDQKYLCFIKNPEQIKSGETILVRVHRENRPRDILRITPVGANPCIDVIDQSLNAITDANCGVFLFIPDEGEHRLQVQLEHKLKGSKTAPPSISNFTRNFGLGAQVLRKLGLEKIKILAVNPNVYIGLEGFHLEIVETIKLK